MMSSEIGVEVTNATADVDSHTPRFPEDIRPLSRTRLSSTSSITSDKKMPQIKTNGSLGRYHQPPVSLNNNTLVGRAALPPTLPTQPQQEEEAPLATSESSGVGSSFNAGFPPTDGSSAMKHGLLEAQRQRSPSTEEDDDDVISADEEVVQDSGELLPSPLRRGSYDLAVESKVESNNKTNALKKKFRFYHEARHEINHKLTDLKQEIALIESQEIETMREMEVERALLDGEYENELSQVKLDKDKMATIGKEHSERIANMVQEREEFTQRIDLERMKLEELEEQYDRVGDRLKDISRSHQDYVSLELQLGILEDKVEYQRKIYEDLEFQQLEDQARFDEEKESMTRDLVSHQQRLLSQYQARESRLQLLDTRQAQVLREARGQMDRLEGCRQTVMDQLRREQLRLGIAEGKLTRLSAQLAKTRSTNDKVKLEKEDNNRVPNHASPTLTTDAVKSQPAVHVVSPNNGSQQQQTTESCGPLIGQEGNDSQLSGSPIDRDNSGEPSTSDSMENCKLAWDSQSGGSLDKIQDVSLDGYITSTILPLRSRNKTTSSDGTSHSWRNKEARPLTRYMPVTELDFNLRRHVESSGHQLDQLSDRVTVEDDRCSGNLWKMGGRIKTWHKRYFVFDRRRHVLGYYVGQRSSKMKGCISFADIRDVFVDHLHSVKSPNPRLTFCVETPKRTYYLVAHSAELMRVWIDVIFSGAEGYLALNPQQDPAAISAFPRDSSQLDLQDLESNP